MENSIEYHSKQNEKISLALNSDTASNPAFNEKPNILYKKLVENEEQARERQLKTLKQNGGELCKEFLSQHCNQIEDEIGLIFGSDSGHRSILKEIYEKIEEDSSSLPEALNSSINITTRSCHFINVKFHETCPTCSGLTSKHSQNILMKTLLIYERAKLSKKSCLSFTTQHKGKIVQFRLFLPCPACCTSSLADDLVIQTSPCIEDEYIIKGKLISEPKVFIEQCVWKWIEDHK